MKIVFYILPIRSYYLWPVVKLSPADSLQFLSFTLSFLQFNLAIVIH